MKPLNDAEVQHMAAKAKAEASIDFNSSSHRPADPPTWSHGAFTVLRRNLVVPTFDMARAAVNSGVQGHLPLGDLSSQFRMTVAYRSVPCQLPRSQL